MQTSRKYRPYLNMFPLDISGMSGEEESLGVPNFQDDGGQHGGQYNDSMLMGLRVTVLVIGIIGNFGVVFVIIALGEYKKAVTNWYVLQLAIADTLFLVTIPFKIAEDAYEEWRFSGAMCKIKEAVLFVNYYSSILFLMAMSIDRYLAICHGFSDRLQHLRTKRSAYIITLIVWVVSLLLSTPIIIESDKRGTDPHCICKYEFPKEVMTLEMQCTTLKILGENLDTCIDYYKIHGDCVNIYRDLMHLMEDDYYSENDRSGFQYYDVSSTGPVYELGCFYFAHSSVWTAFILFNFIVMFVIPFIIMSVCYSLIVYHLRRSRFIPGLVSTSGSRNPGIPGRKGKLSEASVRAERNRIRVTCVCFILVVLFLVCWLPFHAVHLAKLNGIQGSSDKCALMASATAIIAYLNSALNPYIYNCIGTHFRRRFRSAVGSLKTSVKHSASTGVRYQPKNSGTGTSNVSFVSK